MEVKVGFIGTGGIATLHIQGLQRIEGVRITAVYDVNIASSNQAAESTGAQVMNSTDEVLDSQLVDAVFICTPQFARGNLEEIAAQRGIHLFVEKPLGLDLAEVQRKNKIITEAGIIHSVGYCLRYLDTVQQAKAYLQDREPHLIQAYRFSGSHPAKWWHRLDMSGGHLVDAVTHQVDMIRYVVGEISEVEARFGRVSYDHLQAEGTIYDAGAMVFAMKQGAVGSLTESCLSLYHTASDIKIYGADFFVHLESNGFKLTIIDAEHNETITSTMEPYFEQSKAFIESIRGTTMAPILSDYTDGARTLAVTLAANRSFAEQGAIRLSFDHTQGGV